MKEHGVEDWSDLSFYKKEYNYRSAESFASISKIGQMRFSKQFIKEHEAKLKNKTHVILAYSKINHSLIFRFVEMDSMEIDDRLTALHIYFVNGAICFTAGNFLKSITDDSGSLAGRYMAKFTEIPGVGECAVIRLE